MLLSWLADGRYDASTLEDILKEVYGTSRRLFDVTTPHVSGVKIAVTATTINDARLCIFSNYNGVGQRRPDTGLIRLFPVENSGCELSDNRLRSSETKRHASGTISMGNVRASVPEYVPVVTD